MNWIELSVRTDAEGAEAAAAWLNELGRGGAAIEETLLPDPDEPFDPARAFIVRAFFPPDDQATLQRAEEGLWHLAQLRSMSAPLKRELAEEDWAEAWKKYYTILHVGRSLIVKPSWLEYAPESGDIVVELDPGMAFGTGLHPTTRLCMVALEKHWTGRPRVLDVGTGSGILSITAAKLGAAQVLALDTDPIAVETAAANITRNHAGVVARVERGSIDAETHRNLFDLICINILAEVICELAPALASALHSEGILIASGILDYKADGVADALNSAGIEILEKTEEEDWVALTGKKKAEPSPVP